MTQCPGAASGGAAADNSLLERKLEATQQELTVAKQKIGVLELKTDSMAKQIQQMTMQQEKTEQTAAAMQQTQTQTQTMMQTLESQMQEQMAQMQQQTFEKVQMMLDSQVTQAAADGDSNSVTAKVFYLAFTCRSVITCRSACEIW